MVSLKTNQMFFVFKTIKPFFYNNSNIFVFYFFTNNLNFFKNIHSLSILSNLNTPLFNFFPPRVSLNSDIFRIFKNFFFLKRFLNIFRNYTKQKKLFIKASYRHNKFFITLANFKKFKNIINYPLFRPFLNSKFIPYFFFCNRRLFKKTFNYTVGGTLSTYYFELFPKKNHIKPTLPFFATKNNMHFKKKITKSIKNSPNLSFLKLFINNYLYLKKTKMLYTDLKFLFKSTSRKFKRSNYDFFFSKPHTFLNNYGFSKNRYSYSNSFSIFLFRKIFRFFFSLKRTNRSLKTRRFNDIIFRSNFLITSYFAKKKISQKFNSLYLINFPALNKFSLFNLVSPLSSSFFIKKKVNKIKSKLKFIFFFNLLIRSKFYRKTKYFSKINNSYAFKKILKLTRNKHRIYKKIKRINSWLNFWTFLKSLNVINFKWFKRNSIVKYICHNNFYNIFELKKSLNSVFILSFYNLFVNFFYLKSSFYLPFSKKITKFSYLPNKLFLSSKEKTKFRANNFSFLNLSDSYIFSNTNLKNFYNLKKTIYSFPFKNEIKKYILRKYTKSFFISNPFSHGRSFNVNKLDHYFDFSNTLNIAANQSYNCELSYSNELFFLINQNTYFSSNWTYLVKQFKFTKPSINSDSNFIIKRVRFKPGYMNIWRESRKLLKESLTLDFKYQYKLTIYLSNYNKFVRFKTFLISEMSLKNILIRTKLLIDDSLSVIFIKNNLVFLNGLVCSNTLFPTFAGDFIQLVVNLKYYILMRWLMNLTLKKKIRLRRALKNKINKKFSLEDKKRSDRMPNWIRFNKNLTKDVAKFVEVDFFSLSAFILYEPFSWSEINNYNLTDPRFGIINLYNWKYIT